MKNKGSQTDISFFRTSDCCAQTVDADFESSQPYRNDNIKWLSVKSQFDALSNIYPDDIELLLNNTNGIFFSLRLRSLFSSEEILSAQIKLLIRGPIFKIEVEYISAFVEEEKQQIVSILNKSNECKLLDTIFQLESKLTELDKDFVKNKELIQYHYTLISSFQNIDYDPYQLSITRGISKNYTDFTEEASKIDMRNSQIGFDMIKEHLVEKYDHSEPQFNPAAAPMIQLQQLQVCSLSRFCQDFDEISLIGSGGFGKVFKSRNKFDGNYYALKRIALDYTNSKLTEKTKNEAVLLSRIQHPNIVRYYQAWTEEYAKDEYENGEDDDHDHDSDNLQEESEEESDFEEEQPNLNRRKGSSISCDEGYEDDNPQYFENYEQEEEVQIDWMNDNEDEAEIQVASLQTPCQKKKEAKSNKQLLYIQMEYCAGDTLKQKIDEKKLNSEQKRKIIRQILDALYYLHKNNIIHRDLKPQNIFLDGNLNVKLGDFGLATEMKQEIKQIDNKQMRNSIKNDSLTSGVGTFLYLAPEQEQSIYDSKVDVYSLGIILFEMYYPFKTDMERINYITQLRNLKQFPKDFDTKVGIEDFEIREKIASLVQKDPTKRPPTQDLLNEYKDKRVQQVIRSIANPNCPDFYELVQTLFECKSLKQSNNLITSCLEEALTKSPELFFRDFQRNLNELYSRIEKIFKLRGGIMLNLSPLISTQNSLRYLTIFGKIEEYENLQHINHSCRFITQDGGIIQHCQNLIQSTIYWLKMLPLNNFRRYSFGEVQHANRQTFSKQYCATYDIIQEESIQSSSIIELLSISRDIIYQFNDPQNFELKISHTSLFELILLELGFNFEMIIRISRHNNFQYKLLKYIGQSKSFVKHSDLFQEIQKILTTEFNFSDDKAEKFLQFISLNQHFSNNHLDSDVATLGKKKQVDLKLKRTFGDQLRPYFTKYSKQCQLILQEIERFIELALEIKILNDVRIVLEVLQLNELSCYYSGITFEFVEITKQPTHYKNYQEQDVMISKSEPMKKQKDTKKHQKNNYTSYIIGGTYSHYLHNNSNNKEVNNQKYGCGIQIYLDYLYFNKFARFIKNNPAGRLSQPFSPLQMHVSFPDQQILALSVLILTEDEGQKEPWVLAQQLWNRKISALVIIFGKNRKNQIGPYTREVDIKIQQSKSKNISEIKCFVKRVNCKEEEKFLSNVAEYVESLLKDKTQISAINQGAKNKRSQSKSTKCD